MNKKELARFAKIANAEHERVGGAEKDALSHAIQAGHALLAARELLGPDDWPAWRDANCAMSQQHVSRYMRFAYYEKEVRASGAESIRQAEKMISALPRIDGRVHGIRKPSPRVAAKSAHRRVTAAKELLIEAATLERDADRKRNLWVAWECVVDAERIIEANMPELVPSGKNAVAA